MSPEQAEQVLQELDLNGRSPEGQIFHAEGALEGGGTWVMDGWESEQVLGAFIEGKLLPIMARLGVAAPQPKLLPLRVMLTPQEMKHY